MPSGDCKSSWQLTRPPEQPIQDGGRQHTDEPFNRCPMSEHLGRYSVPSAYNYNTSTGSVEPLTSRSNERTGKKGVNRGDPGKQDLKTSGPESGTWKMPIR